MYYSQFDETYDNQILQIQPKRSMLTIVKSYLQIPIKLLRLLICSISRYYYNQLQEKIDTRHSRFKVEISHNLRLVEFEMSIHIVNLK